METDILVARDRYEQLYFDSPVAGGPLHSFQNKDIPVAAGYAVSIEYKNHKGADCDQKHLSKEVDEDLLTSHACKEVDKLVEKRGVHSIDRDAVVEMTIKQAKYLLNLQPILLHPHAEENERTVAHYPLDTYDPGSAV